MSDETYPMDTPREAQTNQVAGRIYGGGKGVDPRGSYDPPSRLAMPQAERRPNLGLEGYTSQELSLDNIDEAMQYVPWHDGQKQAGDMVREALVLAAKAILRNVPRSPRRTLALQHIISARMDANAAISFGGRF